MNGNIPHLQSVQVVSILVQDGRPIVHHTVPSHHPRACGRKASVQMNAASLGLSECSAAHILRRKPWNVLILLPGNISIPLFPLTKTPLILWVLFPFLLCFQSLIIILTRYPPANLNPRLSSSTTSPERRLVIVEGSCRYAGLCVVTPISMEPAHLSTILSMRTWNTSLERSGRLLRTTPWLKSSVALWTQFVLESLN